ncbi:uncharacterized protein ATNIH1004_009385 [Aspergillus tanneri]|uniref:Uncharacterized protein n=2 Tax=Aspergillus tanneri TaxID=1220188 RepID=A0A5M9MDX1_9EURO|nr:uncharacterized protein ATNIH1004_009385 [Aspergillus tanneri]KAA8645168.1 hypothetical protein ATNIH1004_009385 [Aspergillus tanneri]
MTQSKARALKILLLTREDLPECFAAAQDAFVRFSRLLFQPYPLSDESTELMIRSRIQAFEDKPDARRLKAIDTEMSVIMAAAEWSVYLEAEILYKSKEEVAEARLEPRVPELREDISRAYYITMNQEKHDVIGSEEDGR